MLWKRREHTTESVVILVFAACMLICMENLAAYTVIFIFATVRILQESTSDAQLKATPTNHHQGIDVCKVFSLHK